MVFYLETDHVCPIRIRGCGDVVGSFVETFEGKSSALVRIVRIDGTHWVCMHISDQCIIAVNRVSLHVVLRNFVQSLRSIYERFPRWTFESLC